MTAERFADLQENNILGHGSPVEGKREGAPLLVDAWDESLLEN